MNKKLKLAFLACLLLIVFIFPMTDTPGYVKDLFIKTLLLAYLAMAWNILSGFAGQFSFGSALFYGIGGYTSTLLFMNWGISPWIGMWIGAIMAGLVAALEGYLFFRFKLQGTYFALGTLAFAYIFYVIAGNVAFTGKNVGLLLPLTQRAADFQFSSRIPYMYTILVMVVALAFLTKWIRESSLYYKFIAIQQNELSADTLGINPFKYKMIAIIISGMLTALGGTFYAQWQRFIDPALMFGDKISIEILLPAIIGGIGTIAGPIIGSFMLTILNEIARNLFGEIIGMNTFIYGSLLVLTMIFLPRGIVGLFSAKSTWRWKVPVSMIPGKKVVKNDGDTDFRIEKCNENV